MSAAGNYHGSFFSGSDAKGRFTLPVDLRRRVKLGSGDTNTLLVNLAPELSCLTGFGEDHLADMIAEIRDDAAAARARGEALDQHGRAAALAGSVDRITFDDGGRFTLSDDLKEFMGIDDCLYFVGAFWTFEIWAPQRYLDSDKGSELSRMRCRKAFAEWQANPKNPRKADA